MQQVYLPVCLLLFSLLNVNSHFHLRVNSRQPTEIISGFWLSACIENTFHPPASPLNSSPRPILYSSSYSSFSFSHFILIPPSLHLSGWFQACCIRPDLVSRDWNSNYDHFQIAFPLNEKSCSLPSALLTSNPSILTCMGSRQVFLVEKLLTCN